MHFCNKIVSLAKDVKKRHIFVVLFALRVFYCVKTVCSEGKKNLTADQSYWTL